MNTTTIDRRRDAMRPIPHEVRAWFARRGMTATIATHLTTLHANPNWRIQHTRGLALHPVSLLYFPTGERMEDALLYGGTLCYPHVTTCGAMVG